MLKFNKLIRIYTYKFEIEHGFFGKELLRLAEFA